MRTEWISINEKLPILGEFILFCGNGPEPLPTQYGFYSGEEFGFVTGISVFKNVTHWMDLPEPPEDE